MSKIYDAVKADLLSARILRDNKTAKPLQTLMGQITPAGNEKPLSDGDIISVIQKFIKSLHETLDAKKDRNIATCIELFEIRLYTSYLPAQLTSKQTNAIIRKVVAIEDLSEMKQIGQIMKFLKEHYTGRYDSKEASSMAKDILKEKIEADKKYAHVLDELAVDLNASVPPESMIITPYSAKDLIENSAVSGIIKTLDNSKYK